MRKFLSILLVASLLCLAGSFVYAGNPWTSSVIITGGIVADNQTSSALYLPKGLSKVAVYVPTITSAAISIIVSGDGGTTYDDLYCYPNGTNVVLTSTAASTGGYVFEVPCDMANYTHMKVYSGAAQASDRTFKIWGH